jgi:hypothetical protein
MALTIRRLPPQAGVTAQTSAALAEAVEEVLQDLPDDVTVSFSPWDDGDGVRYVCKVEAPAGDPLGDRPPWRFWSGLFATPDALRAELARGLGHRLVGRLAAAAESESAALSPAAP